MHRRGRGQYGARGGGGGGGGGGEMVGEVGVWWMVVWLMVVWLMVVVVAVVRWGCWR